ncbi:homoserine dehydrogenase [Haloimpatiens sp. FM7330]|uniref:homoserine dehydrogenase n=1 Tax=Haloimpatiens sp. FM7330 TaxID=3298610 RepID=UPI0036366BB9
MQKIKIAILGFGNVGKGVWKILKENKEEIMKRSGYEIEISKVLVRDLNKPRGINIPENIMTDNVEEILNDKSIKIVVELIGGEEPAKEYMLRAMKAKKHVVTANKLVLAKAGEELFKTAESEHIKFYYEASVGGGIPIIREINESLTANKITSIIGIINGTTNYILSKMTYEGLDFEKALKEAQEKGYAEADPTSDIEGYDVVYKLAIISSFAFGAKINHESIYREGITNITSEDIKYAKKLGYVIKLLAIGKEQNNKLELRVHPTLVPEHHPIANVNDSFNAIFLKGNAVGDLMLYGRGAGDLPTGSAVVGDIISILRSNVDISINDNLGVKEIKDFGENKSEFYIRFNVEDRPGVLGEIATIFGENDVSIVFLTQDVINDDSVSVIIITHHCLERNLKNALNKIEKLPNINKVESIIRVEN